MYTTVSISADEVIATTGDADTVVDGLERIHVSMAGEARCNGDEESGAEWRDPVTGEPVREEWANGPHFYRLGSDEELSADEQPERVPLSWANSAAITLDEEHDEIVLTVSVGDPRGALAFRVWRDAEGNLHVGAPSARTVWAHAGDGVHIHYGGEHPTEITSGAVHNH